MTVRNSVTIGEMPTITAVHYTYSNADNFLVLVRDMSRSGVLRILVSIHPGLNVLMTPSWILLL